MVEEVLPRLECLICYLAVRADGLECLVCYPLDSYVLECYVWTISDDVNHFKFVIS